jgi:hypothetical protein
MRTPISVPVRAARLRRAVVLAVSAFAAVLGLRALSGCEGDFDPSSKLITLRVLAVRADEPYPKPGTKVKLEMLWHDGKSPPDQGPNAPRDAGAAGAAGAGPGAQADAGAETGSGAAAAAAPSSSRQVQILWLAGCFDPRGDLYYNCYSQIASLLQGAAPAGGAPDPSVLRYVGLGDTFTLDVPADIISRRPVAPEVEPYGLSYVFFFACAGTIGPAPAGASGLPVACFDKSGNALGADDFVPGYLSLYSYDSRTNANPILNGIALSGSAIGESEQRHLPGCRSGACPEVPINAIIDRASAELDPGALDAQGRQLSEQLWVDYYATDGKLAKGARLVNDATKGWNDDNGVMYTPPAPGTKVYLFAVVHDNRGGVAWAKRPVWFD